MSFLTSGVYAQFVPVESWQVARDKLARLNQRTSVATYNEEFTSLMLSIPDMTEQDRVDKYVRGLKLGPKKEVMIRRCKTLADAMATADRVDAVFYSVRNWGRPSVATSAGNNADGPTPMELGQVRPSSKAIALHVEVGAIVVLNVLRGSEDVDVVRPEEVQSTRATQEGDEDVSSLEIESTPFRLKRGSRRKTRSPSRVRGNFWGSGNPG